MGMDVYGEAPANETGEYFRANVWNWRPLATYCCEIAPEITSRCTYWQSNDGDGLDAESSAKLADALQVEIDSGRCALHAEAWAEGQELASDEKCSLCAGSGVRSDAIGIQMGQHTRLIDEPGHRRNGRRGWCNGCNGRGTVRPSATLYGFSAERVQNFVHFLRACGGFKIC